ncbi:conserved hypothetical protein [uncultured Desulfobacterium sp.]|uniref:Helix-turn-helix domain-containing protein n=1 Tax=uncultured Desulfobacterium sp. TaxID=201089 RepID=A0A445MWH5_9BACT|nr:conserved hypothetical protein [uncultured Desulfobacterium sp.]
MEKLVALLVDEEAARILNLGKQTLRNWRVARKGPPYIKMGGSIRYRLDDLLQYQNEKRINPERAETV